MIGVILTGHGSFASGLTSNMELIVGPQENYTAINFKDAGSVDLLDRKLSQAVEDLAACSGILIFTDLLNGTPFNLSVRLTMSDPRIRLVHGVNAAMLIDACTSRADEEDVDRLAQAAIELGRDQIGIFRLTEIEEDEL